MSSKRILVVEDNDGLRSMYGSLLGAYFPDCELVVAENGRAALDLLKEQPVDLVVTDLSMPELNGCELYLQTKAFCEAESRPVPPFIFCSAVRDALDETAEFCIGTVNRKMPKPFKIADMGKLIHELLGSD